MDQLLAQNKPTHTRVKSNTTRAHYMNDSMDNTISMNNLQNASRKSVITTARKNKKGKHKLPLSSALDVMNLNNDSAREMNTTAY